MARELLNLGLLTSIDRMALAAYCQLYARWVKAEEQLAKTGLVVRSPAGYPIQNPYVGIANTALKLLHSFGIEFGLSPASRSRLSVPGKSNSKDNWAALLKAPAELPAFIDAELVK